MDRWAADSPGWGITVGAVVQSLAQFATTWGRDRAAVICDNLPTKVVLPGISNTDDLKALSYLAGSGGCTAPPAASPNTRTVAACGRHHAPRHGRPVIAGHTIAAMPRWHAYVLGLGGHPAVVSYTPGYLRVAAEHATAAPDQVAAAAGPLSQVREPVRQVVPLHTARGRGR